MEINIYDPPIPPRIPRCYVMTAVIKSFKGRRDVDVHLFKPELDEAERDSYEWDDVVGDPMHPDVYSDPERTKLVVMEAFTRDEVDAIIQYFKDRYADRMASVNASPMIFPVPQGMPPLSAMPEGKSIGFIRFNQVPQYPLSFALHGMYDLEEHQPLAPESLA